MVPAMKTLAAISLVATLVGCATPPLSSTPAAGLAGTGWTVLAIDGRAPVAPVRARLTFDASRLSASAGCNGLGGDYRVEGDRLIVGPVVSTQMYCEGVMEQERSLSALFAGAPQVSREGNRLRLASGGHSLEAVAAEAD